jgi:hypothetical protein
MVSAKGRENFQNQLKQLIGSIQYSNDYDVHVALVQAPTYARTVDERYYSQDKNAWQRCREFVDLFGIMQKNQNALDLLIEEAKTTLRSWGSQDPTFMLTNSKLTMQMTMTPEKTNYMNHGPDGQKLLKQGPSLPSYRGLNIINTRSFATEEGARPRDLLNRRVRVAEYYVVSGVRRNEPGFIELYDQSKDTMFQIPFESLYTMSCLPNEDGGVAMGNDGNNDGADAGIAAGDQENGGGQGGVANQAAMYRNAMGAPNIQLGGFMNTFEVNDVNNAFWRSQTVQALDAAQYMSCGSFVGPGIPTKLKFDNVDNGNTPILGNYRGIMERRYKRALPFLYEKNVPALLLDDQFNDFTYSVAETTASSLRVETQLNGETIKTFMKGVMNDDSNPNPFHFDTETLAGVKVATEMGHLDLYFCINMYAMSALVLNEHTARIPTVVRDFIMRLARIFEATSETETVFGSKYVFSQPKRRVDGTNTQGSPLPYDAAVFRKAANFVRVKRIGSNRAINPYSAVEYAMAVARDYILLACGTSEGDLPPLPSYVPDDEHPQRFDAHLAPPHEDDEDVCYDYVIVRPNIEHNMLGVVLGRGGKDELGCTFWGQTELSVYDDSMHGCPPPYTPPFLHVNVRQRACYVAHPCGLTLLCALFRKMGNVV